VKKKIAMSVVDERVQGEVELQIADADREVRLPEGLVRTDRHVRPDDRRGRRDQQDERADPVLTHGADLLGDRTARARLGGDLLGIRRPLDDREFSHY
jgi:hypothetical protein